MVRALGIFAALALTTYLFAEVHAYIDPPPADLQKLQAIDQQEQNLSRILAALEAQKEAIRWHACLVAKVEESECGAWDGLRIIRSAK